MTLSEIEFNELVEKVKQALATGSQGVGDVPEAVDLNGISTLPAYQEVEGQDIPNIVRAPLTLLAAPALEASKIANEEEAKRTVAETGRDNAEKARVTEFSKIKTDAEKATGDAISATGKTNEATQNANVATNAANAATAAANQAAIEANKSAENAEGKAQAAQDAADNANDTAEHPTYIGQDHYVYKWNKTTSSYDKTDIYTKGDAFSIKKVYASVAELEADADNAGIAEGDFVLVNTGDVENPDNAKLYIKAKSDAGVYSYEFLVDMSGAIGFTGKTPQFSMGTISTLEAGSSATATVSEDGVDSDGNPKYKINFAIPRGNPGAPFNPVGQYDTLELLQAAIPDGSGVNGMIAVGTEAPYEYYAWLNGGWVNQGKVAGGGDGRMIIIPNGVIALTEQSSSAEIMNAFGSKDVFTDIVGSVENGAIAAINTPNGNIILPQIKAKANVYEDGEPKFDLTNFVFLGNVNSGANLVEYNSKTIKVTDLAYCGIPLKDNVELGIDDVIKLNCKGGKQYDDGSWYFDMIIYARYYGEEDMEQLYQDNGSQNTYFEFSLNIPAYHNGNKLQELFFSDNSGPMDIEFNSADNATSNYSLSFTYLDPTSLNEGKEYSFYLENDVITLSKTGTGFGFVDIANILYKNNATEYTPTGDYQPATKKYVDNMNYGKVINGSPEILNSCNLTGAEAEAKIATLFGSVDAFRQCVVDIVDNHTRYYYLIYGIGNHNNITEICGNAIKGSVSSELNFIYNYWVSNTKITNRILLYIGDTTEGSVAYIQRISTDDKLKTMFADITQSPEQDLNNIKSFGIMGVPQTSSATVERNYPIHEAGTLFYGTSAYGRANQIYGGFLSNRWFARGAGDNGNTPWREFAFKDDISKKLEVNSDLNNFKTVGVYWQSDTVGLNTVSNKPSGTVGEAVLQVYECGPNYVVQTYYNITDEKMFVRFYHVGTWGSWKSIVTEGGNVFNLEGFDFNTATQAKKEEFIKWVKGYNQIARIVHDSAEVVDDLYIPISSYKIGDYGTGEIINLEFIAIGAREFEIYATIAISVNNPDTGYVDINSIVNIKINRYNISPDFIGKYIVTSDTPTL